MEIESVVIENFKCFKAETKIDFGKLTLLTGANSSGKSSIIYSILGSIQSGEFPFQFSTNGKYVDMGDFKEIIYNHTKKDKIKLKFYFKDNPIKKIDTIWIEDSSNNLPKLFELKAESDYFDLKINSQNKKFIVDFKYNPKNDPKSKLFSEESFKKISELLKTFSSEPKEINEKKDKDNNLVKLFEEISAAQDFKGRVLDKIPPSYDDVSKQGTLKLKEILDLISKLFSDYDKQINFISSFRLHPDRTYLEQTKSKLKVNNFGDGYLDQIIYWETKDKVKFKQLIKTLKN